MGASARKCKHKNTGAASDVLHRTRKMAQKEETVSCTEFGMFLFLTTDTKKYPNICNNMVAFLEKNVMQLGSLFSHCSVYQGR